MIRKLRPDDWDAYKSLRLLSVQTNPDVYFSSFDEIARWNDGNFKSEIYSREESPFGYIGYFEGEKLVGYISLSGQYFAKQKHIADVFNLYVHPEHREVGIAKQLVTAIIQIAREADTLEKLFLSVMSQNTPAISLYSSLGFKEYGKKMKSLKSGNEYFDETLMEYVLP